MGMTAINNSQRISPSVSQYGGGGGGLPPQPSHALPPPPPHRNLPPGRHDLDYPDNGRGGGGRMMPATDGYMTDTNVGYNDHHGVGGGGYHDQDWYEEDRWRRPGGANQMSGPGGIPSNHHPHDPYASQQTAAPVTSTAASGGYYPDEMGYYSDHSAGVVGEFGVAPNTLRLTKDNTMT